MIPISPWAILAIVVMCLGSAGGGSWWITHKIDAARYDDLVIADQKAKLDAVALAAAVQKNQDEAVKDAAVAAAQHQQAIEDKSHAIVAQIPTRVSDTSTCITYGFLRIVNPAATGIDPANIAPGQSDDSCAPVSWRSLAADLADDYATGNQNAQRLNDNIATETAIQKAAIDAMPPPSVAHPDWFERNFGFLGF